MRGLDIHQNDTRVCASTQLFIHKFIRDGYKLTIPLFSFASKDERILFVWTRFCQDEIQLEQEIS